MKTINTLFTAIAMISMANAQTLSIKGSDTLGAKLVPQLAEGFKAAGNTGVKFEIAAEGSTTAFPALANGTAQIGMSSRKIKDDERTFCRTKGVYLKEHEICHDMLVVIGQPLYLVELLQQLVVFKPGLGRVISGTVEQIVTSDPQHIGQALERIARWPRGTALIAPYVRVVQTGELAQLGL